MKGMTKLTQNDEPLERFKTALSENTYFLEDGAEFEIILTNPTEHNLGAEIYANDESFGSIIIVHPKENIHVKQGFDRHIKIKLPNYTTNGCVITVKYYEQVQGLATYKIKTNSDVQANKQSCTYDLDVASVTTNDFNNLFYQITGLYAYDVSKDSNSTSGKCTIDVSTLKQKSDCINIMLESIPFNVDSLIVLPLFDSDHYLETQTTE